MATAYAAVVSLIHLIEEQIPSYIARRPTIFPEKQLGEIKSLKEKAYSIQAYLEASHSLIRDSTDLKRRIVDASYAAADIIELHIVNDVKASLPTQYFKKIIKNLIQVLLHDHEKETLLNVSQVIQKVIQDMDSIITEIEGVRPNDLTLEMIEIEGVRPNDLTLEMIEIEDLQPNNLTPIHSLRLHPSMIDHDTMVGLDDRLTQIMDKLTGQQPTLQIIPITGMGGIGKTTLAQNVYSNSLIESYFDIRGWVTVSQVFNLEQMLLGLLSKLGVSNQGNREYHHLGKILNQHLLGRMYLIIVDDLWNTEVWDKLKLFLPDTKGSRIIVTTRLKEVANYVGFSNLHEIYLLDENKSWSLLCQKTFGQEGCPRPELEEVGRKIAKSCQGLPLSIVVIGGLLVKSKMTLDSWKYVADNVNKIISSEDSDCLDIFLLSYNHLPIHLQPCFLYMGVFPEDHNIRVSELINLWIAEGFLKPNKLKTLEEVAEGYLKDLNERHLIMINWWGSLGTMETCSIHDLLRDMCLREAHREKFISVNKDDKLQDSSQFITEHRIAIYRPLRHAFQSTLLVRSLIYERKYELCHNPNFKLLRVLYVLNKYNTPKFDINLLNLRFMRLTMIPPGPIYLVHRLWNLQTLVINDGHPFQYLTLQIWKMPQLRHLISKGIYICIPDPRCGRIDDLILENLQTLIGIINFKFTEEVIRRIPNVKKLILHYRLYSREMRSHYCLNNIDRLHKLQALTLNFTWYFGNNGSVFIRNCVFPHSLKEFTLDAALACVFEDIITRIRWLPHLEKLELRRAHSKEEEWNSVEGQFPRLKILKLEDISTLVYWNADTAHFPLLEHLYFTDLHFLKEIPSDIGEIETLQSITLSRCRTSLDDSAKNILKEQQSNGNEGFRLVVDHHPNKYPPWYDRRLSIFWKREIVKYFQKEL